MRAASREAQATLREHADALITNGSAKTLYGLAAQVYEFAHIVANEPRLRRVLGDPASDEADRSRLLATLVQGKVAPEVLTLIQGAVASRWSSPWDLSDGLEELGDQLVFGAAERDGTLESVEDELFRFSRVLSAEATLRNPLDDSRVDIERRVALLQSLVAAKVSPATLALLEHAVRSVRLSGLDNRVGQLVEAAAARRHRSVAQVLSAVPLSDEQQTRLASALTSIYGREISVRVEIEPHVQGGLLVRVGDEIIDGTVAARVTAIRAALAS
jgi:F-type H+-transporting ATPase subunit delta